MKKAPSEADPRTLEVPLTVPGYSLRLDVHRNDCASYKEPHWHLCNRGRKIGSINVYGDWKEISYDVKTSIRTEAEQLTALYADRIRQDYRHNYFYGMPDY